MNEYLRKKDGAVKQVTANFLGEHKSIEIIRSGGEAITDIRPLIRFNVSVMLEKDGRKEQVCMALEAGSLMMIIYKMIIGKVCARKLSELPQLI